jgi:pSer/pThr/pTyr-binding forkhead associated (FHA) protein
MISTALCNTYKREMFEGVHSLTDEYRIALYTDKAALDSNTEAYTPEGEVSGLNYEAGGKAVSGVRSGIDSAIAFLSFDSVSWKNATITARGAMVYNASKGNRAVAVFDFGKDVVSVNGTFVVELPSGSSSLIRIA